MIFWGESRRGDMAAAAGAGGASVADLLQRASEAQAAAAAAAASGTAARGEAERLAAAAEAAQVAAVQAVTAAAAAAGLTVGGAGAPPSSDSILQKMRNWLSYIGSRASTLATMAYSRATAPSGPNSLESIKDKLDKATIKNAPIFSIIDPSTEGRDEALIASRTSYMLESKLLDDYINFEIAVNRFGKSKTNPNIAIFTDILGQSIFLYAMSIHKKNRLRIPLEIEAAKGGAGGKLVRGYSGPTNTKGVRIELPPYLMDKINVAIRDMDVNYKMGDDDIIVPGTAGPSATPPSIRGASDLRLNGIASYQTWLNSDYYKALEAHYDSLLASITAATASIRGGVPVRGPNVRPLLDRLMERVGGGSAGSSVAAPSGGGGGGSSAAAGAEDDERGLGNAAVALAALRDDSSAKRRGLGLGNAPVHLGAGAAVDADEDERIAGLLAAANAGAGASGAGASLPKNVVGRKSGRRTGQGGGARRSRRRRSTHRRTHKRSAARKTRVHRATHKRKQKTHRKH
jgi:hypothetical protein